MSATLTLKPLPDSESSFRTAQIKLREKNQIYVIGFSHNPNPIKAQGSDVKDKSKDKTNVTVAEIGFSSRLEDDKLCIVPVDSDEARKLEDTFAAIHLAPGYKVILLPTEGSKVYYQRAVPGNKKWVMIKPGHSVDIADPLLTVLDDAIHIKFDTRPTKRTHSTFMHKLRNWRKQPSSSTFVKHVHTEIEGKETHDRMRRYQIAAHVTVKWGGPQAVDWKRKPSRGDLALNVLRPDDVPGGPQLHGINPLESESSAEDEGYASSAEAETVSDDGGHRKKERKSSSKHRRSKRPVSLPAISRVSREG